MPASLISTPGAITSLRPASWRWAITTARRGGRGINNPGSRPFGARASPPGGYLSASITSTNTLSSALISAKDPFLLDGDRIRFPPPTSPLVAGSANPGPIEDATIRSEVIGESHEQ